MLEILFLSAVLAYSNGAPSCVVPSTAQMSSGNAGLGGFNITVSQETYSLGTPITVQLQSNVQYKGFLIHAVQGNETTIFTNIVGSFSNLASDHHSK